MSDLTFQKDFPERFEIKDNLNPKSVGRRVWALRTFGLIAAALGPIFIVLAYFAVPEGDNFFTDDKYREFLIGLLIATVSLFLMGTFIFRKGGKSIKLIMDQPFVFILTHTGIIVNRVSDTALEIPWKQLKKFTSFRPTAFASGAPVDFEMGFTYERDSQTHNASVRPLTLSRKDLKYVKKYIAAFAPDDAYIDIHNVVDLRQKFGLTS